MKLFSSPRAPRILSNGNYRILTNPVAPRMAAAMKSVRRYHARNRRLAEVESDARWDARIDLALSIIVTLVGIGVVYFGVLAVVVARAN